MSRPVKTFDSAVADLLKEQTDKINELAATLTAIRDIAALPVNEFETESMRFSMIVRLCDRHRVDRYAPNNVCPHGCHFGGYWCEDCLDEARQSVEPNPPDASSIGAASNTIRPAQSDTQRRAT